MKIQKLILSVVLLFAVIMMVRNNNCNLMGTIQDPYGKGIVFSTLEVYKESKQPKLVEEVFTDFNGDFKLKGLNPRFEEKTAKIRLTNKHNKLKTIQLKGNVVLLDPVIIFGKA